MDSLREGAPLSLLVCALSLRKCVQSCRVSTFMHSSLGTQRPLTYLKV